jgi:hypothetical protein
MKQLASIVLGIALAACGGKSTGGATPAGGGAGAADRLPWEAAMTKGARFELTPDMAPEAGEAAPATLVATVTEVEDQGAARVYHLAWMEGEGEADGPRVIRVEGGQVIIGADTKLASMVEPLADQGGATCYAEDFSNPDGCEDVCEASLCLGSTGITSVSGLYAPGQLQYSVK